jgi:hypothetical protein
VATAEAQQKREAAAHAKVRAAEDECNKANQLVRIKLQDVTAEHRRKVQAVFGLAQKAKAVCFRIVRKSSKVNVEKRRFQRLAALKKKYEVEFTREKKRICEERRLASRRLAEAYAEEVEVLAAHSNERVELEAEHQQLLLATTKAAEEGQVKKKPKAAGRRGAEASAPPKARPPSRKGWPENTPPASPATTPRSPSTGNSEPRMKAPAPAPLINRADINGSWKAVCDGIEYSVEVDHAGGAINSVPRGGYNELFKIHGAGDVKSPYTIGLDSQKWELKNYEAGKLSWIGKRDQCLSLWTRVKPVAPVGTTRSIPRSTIPKAKGVPQAPPSTASTSSTPRTPSMMVAAPVRIEDLPPACQPPRGNDPRDYPPKAPPALARPQRRHAFTPSSEPPTPEEAGPPSVELEPEVLSDVSEYVEPPRRIILTDPHIHGFVASPAPDVDDLVEPSKTHLEEVIATVDYEEDPFTKTAFAESAF